MKVLKPMSCGSDFSHVIQRRLKILTIAVGLGIASATLVPVYGQTTYVNENFDSYTAGTQVPLNPPTGAIAVQQVTNVTANGTSFAGGGNVNVANYNDSSSSSGYLEYNVGASPLGNMYISFSLLNNAPSSSGLLTVGAGNWTDATGAQVTSSSKRSFSIEFNQGAGATDTIKLRNGIQDVQTNNLMYTATYNTAAIQNIQIWANDNDTTPLQYLAPDGSGIQMLYPNSVVIYDNNALIGAETASGFAMSNVNGAGNTTGNATLGRVGFYSTTTSHANFLIDNVVISDWTYWIYPATNQGTKFFRLSGPVATTITAFTADGYITWTNAPTNATFTVQTATSLLGPSNWVDYVKVPITNGVNTNRLIDPTPPSGMAFIPAGVFMIGDVSDGNGKEPPTNVYVSTFYMDRTLVTYSQWQTVYNWATNHGYSFNHDGAGKAGANQPVQSVDWYDCVKWCNARSQQEGLTPVYYTDGALTQIYTNREVDITNANVNWTNSGYRLPTEAEWEKAARAGSTNRFPWGDRINDSLANYFSCTGCVKYDDGRDGFNRLAIAVAGGASPSTTPVGSFPPNGYGLYDMADNLDEWCWDWWWNDPPYPAGSPYLGGNDPRGPETAWYDGYRVMRGGSWNGGDATADHIGFYPGLIRGWIGFRCVRVF
jgi:formylglycine-generating enzyme required for sulfatase activity